MRSECVIVMYVLLPTEMQIIKQIEIVVQDSSKPTGISGKIEGENTMEKRLGLFRAHSRIFLWRSEVIDLLNRCVSYY